MGSTRNGSLFLKLFWWLPFGSAPEISAQELRKMMKRAGKKLQILDVRTDHEWHQGHLTGAVHVPLASLSSRVGSLPFKPDVPVVAICLSGHRSVPAVRLLRLHGYDAAVQLAGGMLAWRRAGLPETQS